MRFYTKKLDNGQRVSFASATTQIMAFNQNGLLGDKIWSSDRRLADGTTGHKLIERVIQYQIEQNPYKKAMVAITAPEWEGISIENRNVVKAYWRFCEDTGFRPKRGEFFVYSFKLCVAGKPDALGTIKRLITLPDWKTGIYHEQYLKMQLTLYATCYLEMYPRKTISKLMGVYFDPRTGQFTVYEVSPKEYGEYLKLYIELKQKVGVW